MSPRNPAGGATRVGDTSSTAPSTAPSAGRESNDSPHVSDPVHNTDRDTHRAAQDSALQAGNDAGGAGNTGDVGEAPGLFENHKWLVPATVVFSIIAAFALMVILTWAAGGETPFNN